MVVLCCCSLILSALLYHLEYYLFYRREERRWIDKTNKATRAKLKKEEMARIRNLVDTAYTMDPRIIKFKQEDKDKKLALKQAKRDAARARQEEDERVSTHTFE